MRLREKIQDHIASKGISACLILAVLSNYVYYIKNVQLKSIMQIIRVLEKKEHFGRQVDFENSGIWRSGFVIGCIRWQESGTSSK